VVELEPLSDHGIAEYLPAGQIDGTARWSAVLAQLAAEPDGVLARILSNPLMAYLARNSYAAPTPTRENCWRSTQWRRRKSTCSRHTSL
jgi:hypothetical protein